MCRRPPLVQGQAALLAGKLCVPVVCDADIPKTTALLHELGETEDTLAVCETSTAARAALRAGQTVLVGDLSLLRGLPVDMSAPSRGG
jgi:hypothetical protein